MQHLSGLKDKWLAAIAGAGALDQLENLRVEALGKKGEVTNLMKTLGSLTPEERKSAGQSLNQLKDALTEAIRDRFPGLLGPANADAAREAYAFVRTVSEEYAHAEAD